jgi:carotenoid 1,2-hydratase
MRHCAINVALYGHRSRRWALTERGRDAVARDGQRLRIGPSSLAWDGTTLTARINEVTAPLPSRIRGVVRLHPARVEDRVVRLDKAGRHCWQPIAPCARIEVDLESPGLQWAGPAYCDTNAGDAPLEGDFLRWDWCRAHGADGTTVLYDVTHTDGGRLALAMRYDAAGGVTDFDPPPEQRLQRTRWGVARGVRGETAEAARVVATLQDTPFYARSLVATRLLGAPMVAMHESLDLERFRSPWVQAMLPFRMPRVWW